MKSLGLRISSLILASALSASAQVNVTTFRNDNSRTGQNLAETKLTLANVNVDKFGKLFSQTVDGAVYAQPLYLSSVKVPGKGIHNIIVVVTEHDTLYAFDADSNTGVNAAPLWTRSFLRADKGITTVSSNDVSCDDLTPEIGITGTPVIDASTKTIYLVSKAKNTTTGKYMQRLHALNAANGGDKFGSPRIIQAKVAGSGDGSSNGFIMFDPQREHQRSGLLLQNGAVYIAWASHCDVSPYHAWVMSYDAKTLTQTGVWNSTPNGGLGGVWQAGGAPAADSLAVYMATGNGTFTVDEGGKDYGDSIVKLGPPSANALPILDYFTPFNEASLNGADADLGSGGVLLLPDQTGPHAHLLVQSGKEGTVYLINRDNMGKFNSSNNSQIVQSLTTAVGGMFSTPAFWNNNIYFGGANDNLQAFTFNTSTGLISTSSSSESSLRYGWPGSVPSISASGNSNAIVWTVQTDAGSGLAVLHAYDATNLSKELYNSSLNSSRDSAGPRIKFSAVTIANGKVIVPASGKITVYGLLGQ